MKATKSTRKVQRKKTEYMSDEAFADLNEALEGALAFERGERRDLNVTRIQAPRPPKTVSLDHIARIRTSLHMRRQFNSTADKSQEASITPKISRQDRH